jgi:hypothetical protein
MWASCIKESLLRRETPQTIVSFIRKSRKLVDAAPFEIILYEILRRPAVDL